MKYSFTWWKPKKLFKQEKIIRNRYNNDRVMKILNVLIYFCT